MIILLDTSTNTCKLTISQQDGKNITHEWVANRELAKGLLKFLAEKIGVFHNIQGIGVMKGPGSFAGLRIGLTVANSLSDGLGVPIVSESGENWQEKALSRLKNGENEKIAMPEYGAEAHITKPKK